MRGALFVVCFNFLGSSGHDTALVGDCVSDHDDTLLLQIKAETKTMTSEAQKKRQIHRFQIHMQDDTVSMLQGRHTTNSEVFQICADDDSGSGAETTDIFETHRESCGNLTVTNEAGEFVTKFKGCLQASVAAGDCYALVESTDFFSSSDQDHVDQFVSMQVHQDDPEASDVLLIEIPAMDDIGFFTAMNEVKEKVALIPGAVVLFQGKAAQQARKHMHSYAYFVAWMRGDRQVRM